MGMYNAIIDDELLNPAGIFKERLSQSALVARMRTVSQAEARSSLRLACGQRRASSTSAKTPPPSSRSIKSSISARCTSPLFASPSDFGCDAHRHPVSAGTQGHDPRLRPRRRHAEQRRPPARLRRREAARSSIPAHPLPHFNEVDECAGVDALITNRGWTALGLDPSTTLHDVRWGEHYNGHGGTAQPSTTLSGSCRSPALPPPTTSSADTPAPAANASPPCTSRSAADRSKASASRAKSSGAASSSRPARSTCDLGRGTVVTLPEEETDRRWRETTPHWPIVHAVLHGVSQNQIMARHRANHVNVAYAPTAETADKALATKAAMFAELGVQVHLCGVAQ